MLNAFDSRKFLKEIFKSKLINFTEMEKKNEDTFLI